MSEKGGKSVLQFSLSDLSFRRTFGLTAAKQRRPTCVEIINVFGKLKTFFSVSQNKNLKREKKFGQYLNSGKVMTNRMYDLDSG